MNNNGGNRGVSVIIPVYNEEEAVKKVIRAINDGLTLLNQSYEVIVVNDGSTDNTRKLLDEAELDIRLINHDHNMGYGAAIKTGIRNSRYGNIVITDGDGTYPNERIPELIRTFEEGLFDMVVGARIGKSVKIPAIRKPVKWFLNCLASYLSDTKIPDLNSGLRVMKKEVSEKFVKMLPDGFSFTSTITLAMLTNDYSVSYVPIDYFEREGKSKIRPLKDTVGFVQLVIRMALYFNPLKVFLPLSFPLIIIGSVLVLIQAVFYQNISTVAVITTLTGLQLLGIGMLADLIGKRLP